MPEQTTTIRWSRPTGHRVRSVAYLDHAYAMVFQKKTGAAYPILKAPLVSILSGARLTFPPYTIAKLFLEEA